MNIIGNIDGKNCIILDDMIDTAGTISNAANANLLTEPLVKILVMASAKRGATDKKVILSSFFSSGIGMVFKRTSSSIR